MMDQPRVERAVIAGRAGLMVGGGRASDVLFAPVTPEDAPRLRVGMGQLSSMSRYFRFLSDVQELSEEQIERFTHPDQVDHVAWGALDASRPGLPGLGLGRMIRETEQPRVAELALAVVDAAQGRGVGRVLLAILLARAETMGLDHVHAWVAPENRKVIGWFGRLGAAWVRGDEPWEARFAIPYAAPTGSEQATRLAATIAAVRAVVNP